MLSNVKDSKTLELLRKIIQNFEIRKKMPEFLFSVILKHCLVDLPKVYLIF